MRDGQLVMAGAEAATAVVVSTEEVSAGEASRGEPFVVAVSVQWEVDTCSVAADLVCGVAATGPVAIGAAIGAIIIDSLTMSSSSTTSAFRGGGAGAIRTDITVTTITLMITMGTPGTVTTMSPVTDIAMAADQGICTGRGIGNKRATTL
jgi:hypothetical protein